MSRIWKIIENAHLTEAKNMMGLQRLERIYGGELPNEALTKREREGERVR
jgi:hypothetical protein